MSDDQAKNGFNEAAAPEIVKYADANSYLRYRMNEIIEPINHKPGDTATIAAYGEKQISKLNTLTKNLIAILNSPTPLTPEDLRREAEGLGYRHNWLMSDLDVHLGAASEILRRYDAWIADANANGSAYLQQAMTAGKQSFEVQLKTLETARAQAIRLGAYIQNIVPPSPPPAPEQTKPIF